MCVYSNCICVYQRFSVGTVDSASQLLFHMQTSPEGEYRPVRPPTAPCTPHTAVCLSHGSRINPLLHLICRNLFSCQITAHMLPRTLCTQNSPLSQMTSFFALFGHLNELPTSTPILETNVLLAFIFFCLFVCFSFYVPFLYRPFLSFKSL